MLYIIWLFTRVWFINQQLGPGILWKLGEVVVLSTLLTVLEQQSTRWSQAKKRKIFDFFWVWDDFRGIFGFRFVSHLFSSFSQVNSNFAAELFCSKPSVEKIDSWNPPVEMVGSPTVDGSEIWRSPPAMYKTLWIMGQTTYQLVQNVFHQQYCAKNWSLFTHKAGQQFLSVQFSTTCFPIFLEKCSTD